MKATIEQLRTLNASLADHRIQHENLVSEMNLLRQHCQELRSQWASAANSTEYNDGYHSWKEKSV